MRTATISWTAQDDTHLDGHVAAVDDADVRELTAARVEVDHGSARTLRDIDDDDAALASFAESGNQPRSLWGVAGAVWPSQ